jgi:hypothetical protein
VRIYNLIKILSIFIISGFLIFTGKVRVEADTDTVKAINDLTTTTVVLINNLSTTTSAGFAGVNIGLNDLSTTTMAGLNMISTTTSEGFSTLISTTSAGFAGVNIGLNDLSTTTMAGLNMISTTTSEGFSTLTSTTSAGFAGVNTKFDVLTSTTDTGFTNVTNELRRGNLREEADKLKSDILNRCKNNIISGCTGLDGGVLEIKDISCSIDLYELQDTIIKNNEAAKNGGAFTIVNSEKVSFYNVNVYDNEAVTEKGGAFYIENSTVIFNTSKVSIFKGNKANGLSSAMYIGANSDVYFNTTEGAIVDMNDALTNNAGTNGNLHIMGRGKFNLNKTSEINGTNVKIEARGQLNLHDNVDLYANSIGIDENTVFRLKGNIMYK